MIIIVKINIPATLIFDGDMRKLELDSKVDTYFNTNGTNGEAW